VSRSDIGTSYFPWLHDASRGGCGAPAAVLHAELDVAWKRAGRVEVLLCTQLGEAVELARTYQQPMEAILLLSIIDWLPN
jgi:hypothetical protein